MMQKEFENLVGHPVDNECYKRIEAVYMYPLFDDLFPTKEAVASYYKKHDMQGFENLYKIAVKVKGIEAKAQNLEKELSAVQRKAAEQSNYAAQLEIVVGNLKKIVHEMTEMM